MKNTPNRNRTAAEPARIAPSLRLLAAVLAALIAFCLTAGCSRGSRGDATAAPNLTEAPTPEATKAPTSGGKLRMAMPENLQIGNESYDPLIVSTEEALQLYSLVYEPLIAIDEQNALVPCLAINWSAASKANSWTVNLREGVRWHSGEALTADDVIRTWQLLQSLGSESYYRKSLSSIVSMEKLDATTLLVTMSSPGLMELYSLNFPIVREGGVLVGTGAYRVISYSEERIAMVSNPNWWDRSPYITELEFLARDSNETALASYSAGQLDLVPTALLAAGKYGDAGVTVVRDYMTQGMETMLFNHRRSLTMNADFRRGVAHSVNRTRIIANVYMNRARSCDVPVPPDSWLYNSSSPQIDFNPSLADQYFAKAGLRLGTDELLYHGAEPVKLTLLVSATSENTTRADAASAIAAQLAARGITVEIVTAAHSYGRQESEFLTALRQMNWDIALVGFNLAQSNELSPYLSANGANNFGAYPGELFTADLRDARSAPDEESLRARFYDIQARFIEELPFIVLYFRLNSLVARASLKGVSAIREPALLRNIKYWYLREQ